MNLFTVAFLFLATALVALAKPIASNCPATPDLPVEDLPSVTALHDPFTFLNGQKVVTKDDWACRREEILDLVQKYEFGTLPPKATILSAVVDWYNFSRAVDITVGHEGKEFNFTSFFTLPIEPTVEGPYPLLLSTASDASPFGLNLDNNIVHAYIDYRGSRFRDKFAEVYGRDHGVSEAGQRAWAASLVIDALQLLPMEEVPVDLTRLGIGGCSWYSHAALLASALDHRFLFTIIRDSEAYASGCWRTAEAEQQTGTPVLTTLTSQLWENSYVLDNYPDSLRAFIGKTDTLPYDHHLLTALVAPRPLVVLETSKSFWLGQSSAYVCQKAAQTVWKAFGAGDSYSFSQTNETDGTCSVWLTENQHAALRPFYEKYFYGRDVKTGRFETELEVITLDEEDWIQWETPVLVD